MQYLCTASRVQLKVLYLSSSARRDVYETKCFKMFSLRSEPRQSDFPAEVKNMEKEERKKFPPVFSHGHSKYLRIVLALAPLRTINIFPATNSYENFPRKRESRRCSMMTPVKCLFPSREIYMSVASSSSSKSFFGETKLNMKGTFSAQHV